MDSSQPYRNSHIELTEDKVIRPDGKPDSYTTATLAPGVAILAIDDDRNVYLTRQFRYALGRESIEIISGAVEEGESPERAARREAREELGIEADQWDDMGVMDMDTSVVCAPVHLFVARGLRFHETHREGTEQMETLKLPFDRAREMVMANDITHSPSCVLLLKEAVRAQRNDGTGDLC